jgi:glycine oxidase
MLYKMLEEEILAGKPDVVVVGAGVMGCSAAYWLSKEGYKVLMLEKEAIACGASGMASAHWLAIGRSAREVLENGGLSELGRLGFRLHQELACVLPQESGIDIGYQEQPMIYPAFSAEEGESLKSQLSALRRYDPSVRWLEGQTLWEVEPRLNRDVLGGLVVRGAQVMAYRFVLALVEAAERRGMELQHGEVVGLQSSGGRVTGVQLRRGEIIATETVVLAMGPWSQRAAAWVGQKIPVYPVRGQLLELLVPNPQLHASLSYSDMYLLHKANGVTLAGTTYEPDSGFANHPTPAGLEAIINATVRMAPSLEDAQVADHVSGLRPASEDSLPLIGPIPGWQGVYMVSGHDRNGMGLSLISTRIIADLIIKGHSPVPLEMFDPARFGSME